MALALNSQVDIVFETEDESFYSALTTLINTTKRPIILTLGAKEERVLLAIKERIKTCFDVIHFDSPDLLATCNQLFLHSFLLL